MNTKLNKPALDPSTIEGSNASNYPDEFKPRVVGRFKRRLGDALGLKNFGVNLTTIKPGSGSALRHCHAKQDEFIYVISGELVLLTDGGEQTLTAGMAAGFPAGAGDAHCLLNRSGEDAVYIEVGDRTPGESVIYADDDIAANFVEGRWQFTRKDGKPF